MDGQDMETSITIRLRRGMILSIKNTRSYATRRTKSNDLKNTCALETYERSVVTSDFLLLSLYSYFTFLSCERLINV